MLHNLFSSHWRLSFCLTMPLISGAFAFGGEAVNEAQLRAHFVAAQPGREKGAAARRMLSQVSPQDIQGACCDEDNSVALCAAWRRLEMQMNARFVGPDRAASIINIPAEVSREFLGFVEGRLQVVAPDVWTRNLLTARFGRWEAALFSVSSKHGIRRSPMGRMLDRGRSALPSVSAVLNVDGVDPYVRFEGRDVLYEGQDASVVLPKDIANELVAKREVFGDLLMTGIATDDRAVIVLPNGPGEDILICLASMGRPKAIWRCRMDSYWGEGYKGPVLGLSEFRLKKGLLYIFHSTHDSLGIECLSVADGSRRFSFNSLLPK